MELARDCKFGVREDFNFPYNLVQSAHLEAGQGHTLLQLPQAPSGQHKIRQFSDDTSQACLCLMLDYQGNTVPGQWVLKRKSFNR